MTRQGKRRAANHHLIQTRLHQYEAVIIASVPLHALFLLANDFIDDAVVLSLLRRHPVVALHVLAYF